MARDGGSYEAGQTLNFLNFSPENPFRGCDSAKTSNEQTVSLTPLRGAAFGTQRNFQLSKNFNGYIFDSRKIGCVPNAAPLSGARENFYSMGVLADSEPANGFSGVNFIFFVRSKLCVRSFFSFLKDRSRILFSNFFIVKNIKRRAAARVHRLRRACSGAGLKLI